jgi:S1-C subfamily serine protease
MKGLFPRGPLLAATVSAAIVAASSLFFGHAGRAVSAPKAGPRTGVVVVNTNLAFVDSAAAGTGIVLTSSGLVLTNNHVIRGATTIRITDPSDGLTFPARVLGYSVLKDVALLQLQHPRGLKPARLGNSSSARVGEAVTAVGNAGGTGSLSVVTGRVIGLGRTITVSDDQGSSNRLVGMIETSAPLEPGDSGGPLLANGRVIGVDAAASQSSGFDESGDGFAIPINTGLSIAHQIESGRRSSTVHVGPTAFLGVLLSTDGGSGGPPGAAVQSVVPGSAADRAGIQGGDVITRAGGQTITSAARLHSIILRAVPGKPLRLTWIDSTGNTTTATVRPPAGPPQ